MHYYQHNIADYRADTAHLSMLEHGAYRQLLDWYYLDEKPIPTEINVVFRRLCARTEEEREAVKTVLSEFFSCSESGYSHVRCDREIASYAAKAGRARDNGKLGGRPKKTKEVISRNLEETHEKANHKPLTNNQEPIKEENLSLLPAEADNQSLPNCPQDKIRALYAEILPELPQPRVWEGVPEKELKQRWRWVMTAKKPSGERYAETVEQGLVYFERMFRYIRGSDFLMGRSSRWNADLRWIVKAANFDKIISGNYENARAA